VTEIEASLCKGQASWVQTFRLKKFEGLFLWRKSCGNNKEKDLNETTISRVKKKGGVFFGGFNLDTAV